MVKLIGGALSTLPLLLLLLCICGQDRVEGSSGNKTHPLAPSPELLQPKDKPQKNSTTIPDVPAAKKTPVHDADSSSATNHTNSSGSSQEKKKQVTPDHCCGAKVHACLSSPGDASVELYSLIIQSRDSVNVKIITPDFLRADPAEFTTNGQDLQVKVEVVDAEAAKLAKASNITIQSEGETCQLPVPSQNPGYLPKSYSTLRSPAVGFAMLGLALVLVLGSWAYCRYRLKNKSRNDGSYVDVEMGMQEDYNQSAANESTAAGPGISDDWNEVWDEDWNDTADENAGSSQFKLTESLSSKGLAARKTAKEWTD